MDAAREQRGLGGDAAAIVLSIVASGAYDAIKVAVAKVRERMPRAEISVEGEDQDDREAAQPDPPHSSA